MASAAAIAVAKAARKAGFVSAGGDRAPLTMAVAVALAESGGRPDAVNVNTDGSRDRGAWQINDRWHPEVSDTCAFDLDCAATAAFRISLGGVSWGAWAAYTNGSYKSHLSEAKEAVVGSLADIPGFAPKAPITGPTNPLDAVKDIAHALGDIGAIFGVLAKAGAWLGNRHNWVRILEVVGGLAGVVVALELLGADLSNVSPAAIAKPVPAP